MWRGLFAAHILERGYRYYQDGAVTILNTEDDWVHAEVEGSELYEVDIELNGAIVEDMTCTCPYAEDGNNCKHMAAVLYALERGGLLPDYSADEKLKSHRNSAKQDKPTAIQSSIEQLVQHAEERVVRSFLTVVLEQDKRLAGLFQQILNDSGTNVNQELYRAKAERIFDTYMDYDGYMNYHEAWEFSIELTAFLDNDVARLMRNQSYSAVWEFTVYIFEEVAQQEMDDSAGGLQMIADSCMALWDALAQQSGNSLKQKMYRWCIDWLQESDYEYFDDVVRDFWKTGFQEKDFLQQKLDFALQQLNRAEQQKDGWRKEYQTEQWLQEYFELLQETEDDAEQLQVLYEQYWKLPMVRAFYVNACMKNRNYANAEKALKDGLILDVNKRGLIQEHQLKLKEIYQNTGRREEYLQILWDLNTRYLPVDLAVFRELKKQYSAEEWLVKREKLFRMLPSNADMARLYKEEKLYDKLLCEVTKASGLSLLQLYEKDLKKRYPIEILHKYTEELQQMAQYASERKRYRELVELLRQMKTIEGGTAVVEQIATDWRVQYKRRPAMMEELAQL